MELEQKLTSAELRLGRTILRLDEVEAQNKALRAQLEARTQQHAHIQQGGERPTRYSSPTASAPVASQAMPVGEKGTETERYEALARKYADLQGSHARLQIEHDACHRRIEKAQENAAMLRKKCKEYKDGAKRWKEYAERQVQQRLAALESKATQTEAGVDRQERVVEGQPAHIRRAPVSEGPSLDMPTEHEMPSSPPQLGEKRNELEAVSGPKPHAQRVTSSQTTMEPTQPPNGPAGTGASSDFEPIFVQARSLKRKRGKFASADSPPRRIKQEHDSSNAVIMLDSDPITDARTTSRPSEESYSSDLDRTGPRIITPVRAERLLDLDTRAPSEEITTRQLPRLNRRTSSHSKGSPSDLPSPSELARSGPLVTIEHSTGKAEPCAVKPAAVGIRFANRAAAGALQQISPNVPLTPRNGVASARPRPRSDRSSHAKLLSEATDSSSQVSLQRKRDHDAPTAGKEDQLEEMLNDPSFKRTPKLLKRANGPVSRNQHATATTHLVTPVSEHERRCLAKRRSPPKSSPRHHESPPPIDPEDEPLRLRNVRSLKLEDFKINPKYLGSEFAFADTLRGRDQRRELHTCTKADCCGGALAKAVAMGGPSLSGKTDEQALEAYIGSNWRDTVGNAGVETRAQMITQAHAHCFTTQYGKHRQAFERPSTPPGFWRTDFPTTQENASDREKAHEMERQEVEARHRVALRGDGRWIFRDE